MIICSIDPGSKGSICLLEEGKAPSFFDINKNPIAAAKLAKTYNPDIWVMEKVHANSTDAKQAIWSFARNVGQLEGKIDAPIFYVTPRTWQSWAGIYGAGKGKGTKKKAYEICTTMYGKVFFTGPRGGILDGRCDALLIGHWYVENVLKKNFK